MLGYRVELNLISDENTAEAQYKKYHKQYIQKYFTIEKAREQSNCFRCNIAFNDDNSDRFHCGICGNSSCSDHVPYRDVLYINPLASNNTTTTTTSSSSTTATATTTNNNNNNNNIPKYTPIKPINGNTNDILKIRTCPGCHENIRTTPASTLEMNVQASTDVEIKIKSDKVSSFGTRQERIAVEQHQQQLQLQQQ